MVPCAEMSIQEIMKRSGLKQRGAYTAKKRGYFYTKNEIRYPVSDILGKSVDVPDGAVSVANMNVREIKYKYGVSSDCALRGAKRGYIYPDYKHRKIQIDENCDLKEYYNFCDMVIATKTPYLSRDDKQDARQDMVLRMYELSGVENMKDFSFRFMVAWNELRNWLNKNEKIKNKYFKLGLISQYWFQDKYYLFYKTVDNRLVYTGIFYHKKREHEQH